MAKLAKVYPVILNPAPEGGYDVSFPDFPGCVTFGRTFEDAHQKAAEVLALWLEELDAQRQSPPKRTGSPILTEITLTK